MEPISFSLLLRYGLVIRSLGFEYNSQFNALQPNPLFVQASWFVTYILILYLPDNLVDVDVECASNSSEITGGRGQ